MKIGVWEFRENIEFKRKMNAKIDKHRGSKSK